MGKKTTEAVEKYRREHRIVEVKLRLPLPEKERIWEYAKSQNKTLAGYIKECIYKDMEGQS